MTGAEKAALIKKLGAKSSKAFDPRYSEANRKWFVGKVIDFLLAQSPPVSDADVETKTNDIVTQTTKALVARVSKGFSTSSLKDKWALYDKRTSRTQIIYGMVALHLEFLDTTNAAYFDFILERRFRAIQRMSYFVNPNDVRNVFAYTDTDAFPPEKMKVNKQSVPNWTGVVDGTYPFILSETGKSDPVNADENLFKANKGSDRNLFACDPVATVLHMDALRVARTPDALLKALASNGDHYLKIDNPLGHFANYPDGQRLVGVTTTAIAAGNHVDIPMGRIGSILGAIPNLTATMLQTNSDIPFTGPRFMIVQAGVAEVFVIESVNPLTRKIKVSSLTKSYPAGAKIFSVRTLQSFYGTLPYHFLTDSRPDQSLFEQLTIKATELQVGDHAYVINHPLYKIYYPSGAWGGEHSFISEIDTRDSASSAFRSSLKLAGHGVRNTTLLGMVADMLIWNNKVLAILQALTRIHLNYLKTNGRKSTTDVTFTTRLEPAGPTQQVNVNVFEYNVSYTYTFPIGGKTKKSPPQTKGFVIKEQAASPDAAFQLFNLNGTASRVDSAHPPPPVFLVALFTSADRAEQFMLSKWAAPFFNPQTAQFQTQPLFEADNKTPKFLTFDDLVKAKPFLATDDVGDVYVTRPRVDFSATYQSFLRSSGAI